MEINHNYNLCVLLEQMLNEANNNPEKLIYDSVLFSDNIYYSITYTVNWKLSLYLEFKHYEFPKCCITFEIRTNEGWGKTYTEYLPQKNYFNSKISKERMLAEEIIKIMKNRYDKNQENSKKERQEERERQINNIVVELNKPKKFSFLTKWIYKLFK